MRNPQNECYSCKHRRNIPGNCHIACSKPDYTIEAQDHGVINGWFIYPLCFDPVWKLTECKNYEANE